jgi:hypothetical protein
VKEEERNTILLMSGKDLLDEVRKEEEMKFPMVRKPRVILTSTSIDDLLEEVREMLENFGDIVVHDLPCLLLSITSMIHQIELIPGVSFPNKEAYRLMP